MNGLNESKSYWARKLFGRDAKAKTVTSEAPSRTNDGLATATLGRPSVGSKATVLLFQARADGNGGTAVLAIDGNTDDEGNVISTTADVNVSLVEGQRVSVIRSGRDLTVIPDGDVVAATAEPIATEAANSAVAQAVGQYFWHDTQGVHVSQAKPIIAGTRNILLNSYGMALYNGDPAQTSGANAGIEYASFTGTAIELGKNCTINSSVGSEGTVALKLYDKVTLKLKRILFMPWYTGSTPPAGNTKDATVIDSAFVADEIKTNGHIDGNTATFNKIRSSEYYDSNGVVIDTDKGKAAFLTNTAAASTTTSLAKVTLGSTIVRSDSNLFAKSSNGIQCKKAGTVLVSGEVYCQNLGSSNNLAVDIYKGTASQFEVVQSCGMTGFATAAITPRALTVAANDVISLYVKSTTAASSGIPIGGACLTVQYI